MTQRRPKYDLSAKAVSQRIAELKTKSSSPKEEETTSAANSEKTSSNSSSPTFYFPKRQHTTKTAAAKPDIKIKWNRLLPLIIVIVLVLGFVITSRAGIIQTFITPEDKKPDKVVEAETTTEQVTTTEPVTTTEEETTTTIPIDYNASYYVIEVNLAYNVVTVYIRGDRLGPGEDLQDTSDDEYDLEPLIAFTCSTGVDAATPEGTYYIGDRASWCFMQGDVYARYATRIHDGIMFHSVPYYSEDPGDLEVGEYNILGYDASAGCIRLNCRDAYWIYCNAAEGTEVRIIYDWSSAGPLDTETIYRVPTDIPQLYGWDPTDTVTDGNPWLSYDARLTNADVTLPYGASVDDLLAALGPTDQYGNDLSEYFWTDGGYDLWSYGTYYTVGHFEISNLSFSYDISITVSDDYWDNYSGSDNSGDSDNNGDHQDRPDDAPNDAPDDSGNDYSDDSDSYDSDSDYGDSSNDDSSSNDGYYDDNYQGGDFGEFGGADPVF